MGETRIEALKLEVETLRVTEDHLRRLRQNKEEKLRVFIADAFLNAPLEQEEASLFKQESLTINP